MKTIFATSLVMLLLALGSAFAQAPPPLQSDYYPLKEGKSWTYSVLDMKAPQAKPDPKKIVEIKVEKEAIYTRKKLDKAGKELAEKFTGYLLKTTSGDKSTRDQVVVLEEGIHRVHTAGTMLTPPLLFFKLPLKDGETWEGNSTSGNIVIKGKFTARNEKVTVPAGTYETMAITFRSDPASESPYEFVNWFAREVGMVKHHVKTKNHEIVLELQKFDVGK